jgi:putative phosphoserine phosphatase/1-acylglycerol-3-phosphate O-acyltransferase
MSAPRNIGAFFDLDGTLLAPPSLEWRFAGFLLEREQIRTANLARWIARAAKAILAGPSAVLANKDYLAGIHESIVEEWGKTVEPGSLPLFAAGVDRMRWHLESGHRVVLVTGALAPLARAIARHLSCGVEVRATELETKSGHFTGRLSGAHVSLEQKARVIREAAAGSALDLSRSFAYGNAMSDARMLEAVGHPAAVNASWRLEREARQRGWTIYRWSGSHEAKQQATGAALAPKEAR